RAHALRWRARPGGWHITPRSLTPRPGHRIPASGRRALRGVDRKRRFIMALRLPVMKAAREETPLRELRAVLPRTLTREGIVVEQHIREGRFQRSLSLLAGLSSILGGLEVLYEHYRGSYSQRIMYSPVLLSPALLVAGIWGALS